MTISTALPHRWTSRSAQRVRSFQFEGEAAAAFTEAFNDQVLRASEQGAAAGVAIAGDAAFRIAFLTLLPVDLQRTLFLQIVTTKSFHV